MENARFRSGIGMERDRHAAGGERQTSLLAGETRDWMEKQTEPGLCFRRYKANLITEGIDTTQLNTGDLLAAGGAVFRADRENRIAIVLIAVFYFFNISFNCCHIFMLSVFRRFSLIVVFLLTVCELDKLTSSDRNCGQRILCDHRGNASFLLDQGIQTA